MSAVWANEGGDKVAREELRASSGHDVVNSVWNGEQVVVFGAKNEVVNFQVILEAKSSPAHNVSVELAKLVGPSGATITSKAVSGNDVFNWVGRNIELFYIRYLQIRGLSLFAYPTYDERHVPHQLQRPGFDQNGLGAEGGWNARPLHDAHYPDIAVPMEWVKTFNIDQGHSQAIWSDIYIPKNSPAGLYYGYVTVREGAAITQQIPVVLQVRDFTLPDAPSAKTMLFMGHADINERYLGIKWPSVGPLEDRSDRIRDRHFQLAHRHKISLIDNNDGAEPWGQDAPRPEWVPRLTGQLFTAAQGYDGPGIGVGNGVYAIGVYGTWRGESWDSEAEMRARTDAWEQWFTAHAPHTERFLYLIDESSDYAQIETWANWINRNPGPGGALLSMATLWAPTALAMTPSLDIPTSTMGVGVTDLWEATTAQYRAKPDKRVYMYNGRRPAAGTFLTEDDGVALRVTPWAQFKKKIDRWFYWESTYYSDSQTCGDRVNLFQTAKTFGCDATTDPVLGRTGTLYNNGDGVLFYPGTDTLYPSDSYGMDGPIASLRLKYWRRGIQDADYLALAQKIDPQAVQLIMQQMVPKVLWEYGVADVNDPSWIRTDISWSVNPDDWESARKALADLIEQSGK